MDLKEPEREKIFRSSRLRRVALAASIGAALFYAGYSTGNKNAMEPLETVAALPPAEGFLDYPGKYVIEVRSNTQGERETYLIDAVNETEWAVPEAAPRLFNAYAGNGRFLMEGATRTVEASRSLYGSIMGGKKPAKR